MDELSLVSAFTETRHYSHYICRDLYTEDYALQAAPFVSPPKWHLAHTSWFFETFILKPFKTHYQVFDPLYEVLFNSYYNGIGKQFPRPQRGLLSRPTLAQVEAYRAYIDKAMLELLEEINHSERETILQRCYLGIQHEQQHQELFFTDLKYSFFQNPLFPAYCESQQISSMKAITNTQVNQKIADPVIEGKWCHFSGGLSAMGVDAKRDVFSFDNESPQHKTYLEPFSLFSQLVTNKEYQAFIDDGGYQKAQYWLADGWAHSQENGWTQPLYWLEHGTIPMEFTLYGLQERQANQPVCHISAYEADAYANWRGLRLPTEAEWEHAAKAQATLTVKEQDHFHPSAHSSAENALHHKDDGLVQLFDACWQWTSSAYRPYPGFKPTEGAIGEYNGKFMCNQWVLRGGSCVSSKGHLRPSYRNFFYPQDRWQFSGIRLAK